MRDLIEKTKKNEGKSDQFIQMFGDELGIKKFYFPKESWSLESVKSSNHGSS